jgi:predicted ABC-type ATPase
MESLLIITGTMGAGKTSVLAEASDILAKRRVTHAAIDVDALGLAHLPIGASNDAVMYASLAPSARTMLPSEWSDSY